MDGLWQHLTPGEYTDLFPQIFTTSAFRLEQLDWYASEIEAEPLRRYLEGKPDPLTWRQPWVRLIRDAVAAKKEMARVRVVTEPWTSYTAFELRRVYPIAVDAGEDIRVAVRGTARFVGHDFWLVDDTVARMEYDPFGEWTGAALTENPTLVSHYRTWRAVAIAASRPLATYLDTADHRRTA